MKDEYAKSLLLDGIAEWHWIHMSRLEPRNQEVQREKLGRKRADVTAWLDDHASRPSVDEVAAFVRDDLVALSPVGSQGVIEGVACHIESNFGENPPTKREKPQSVWEKPLSDEYHRESEAMLRDASDILDAGIRAAQSTLASFDLRNAWMAARDVSMPQRAIDELAKANRREADERIPADGADHPLEVAQEAAINARSLLKDSGSVQAAADWLAIAVDKILEWAVKGSPGSEKDPWGE